MSNQPPTGGVQATDERVLIAAAQGGDTQAFAELAVRHQHEVFTLALRLVANRELAAEVAQESLIKAWRALPRFRGEAAFATWLHRITVNTAWTLRHRARRQQHEPIDAAYERADRDERRQPERVAEIGELRSRLRVALAKLPASLRSVVVMKDVYGWSHAEVADALGISVTAAKVRLHRAHRRLQEDLKQEVA